MAYKTLQINKKFAF